MVPGHEARRLRRQEHHGGADLFGHGVSLLRGVFDPVSAELRVVDRRHVRLDVAGRHRVHPDPVRSPFGSERLRQVVDRRLRGVVGGLHLGTVHDHARHRPDVDDAAASPLHHVRSDRLGHPPEGGEVRVEDMAPLGVGHLEGGPVDAGAGVVDEDVDLARGRDSRLRHLGGGVRAGQLAEDDVGPAPEPTPPPVRTSSAAAGSRPWTTTSPPASAMARAKARPEASGGPGYQGGAALEGEGVEHGHGEPPGSAPAPAAVVLAAPGPSTG